MCYITFVQHSEPRGRHFANFHYYQVKYCYYTKRAKRGQKIKGAWFFSSTHNDVKLGVDVADAPVVIQDRQGGDAVLHEQVEGLDQRHVLGHLRHMQC